MEKEKDIDHLELAKRTSKILGKSLDQVVFMSLFTIIEELVTKLEEKVDE